MGANQSLPNPTTNVFSKELHQLNTIINNVLTSDEKFVNTNYNFLFEDVCRNYTILWEKELGKHLKVDLENLSGSIYLLPKKDLIVSHEDKVQISKQELCEKISKHYVKILYILTLIKHVFDLENGGDNSIAGIMKRNIKMVGNIMEINYCSIPQKDYDMTHTDRIKFDSLQGFKMFVENFLTPIEKYAFLEQFKSVIARKPQHKIFEAVCHDALIPLNVYESIFAEKLNRKIVCHKTDEIASTNSRRRKRPLDLMFEVAEDNPIFHTNYCMSRKKLVIPLNGSTPKIKELKHLHTRMQTNYEKNVQNVVEIFDNVLDIKGDVYELKNISSHDLQGIIKELKSKIVVFYIQSLVDFHLLLDVAKDVDSVKVNQK